MFRWFCFPPFCFLFFVFLLKLIGCGILCNLVNAAFSFRITRRFPECPRLGLLSAAEFAVSGRGLARGCRGIRDGDQSVGEAVQVLSVHAQPQQLHRRCVKTVCSRCFLESTAHSCCVLVGFFSSGLAETSKANGSSHSQDHFVSLAQAAGATSVIPHPQKGKGTFTDDLLQLVDNFARDAISLSQCKRGPKNGAAVVVGHDVSTFLKFFFIKQ